MSIFTKTNIMKSNQPENQADNQQMPIEEETLLDVGLVRSAIRSTMPELLAKTQTADQIRDKITFYLFGQPNLRSAELRKVLTPELYNILYGLKTLLQKNHLNRINWAMDEHHRWADRWIRYFIMEEE
mgnify:CR=1 FL=1